MPESPPPPLGEVLATVHPRELQDPDDPDADLIAAPRITDSQYLASYNWLRGNKPCVAIPGKKASTL